MKVAAIINPISGAGADADAAARRIAILTEQLERRGLRASIALTTHAGHARELAAAAANDRADVAIVWGGDGTVNEAGTALLGTETALALVPAGSGNGLAAALATPRDPVAAIALALDGRRRQIDAGLFAGRPFFNIAGIGVDARIARRFNERAQGSRGPGPYFAIGVSEGCRYCAPGVPKSSSTAIGSRRERSSSPLPTARNTEPAPGYPPLPVSTTVCSTPSLSKIVP